MAIPYIVSGSQNYKVFLPSSDLRGNVLLATILQMTLTTGMVNCSLTRISTSPSLLELRRCSTRPLASSCQRCHEATWSKSEYLNWLLRLLAKSKLFKIAQNKPEWIISFHQFNCCCQISPPLFFPHHGVVRVNNSQWFPTRLHLETHLLPVFTNNLQFARRGSNIW